MVKLADLPGLGPKSEQMLIDAGIDSFETLKEIGSVRAYLRVKSCRGSVSLNLLYALEGALQGRHWLDIASSQKAVLIMALEEHQDVEKRIFEK
ncbi:TfoX/Sxy family protein [Pseudoalteromonas sp. S16_S37]|uniref:TfoX/Sxy family protein n=1 Tax=Pseudoalteromonas sp. S16_S37 TaxID=2720228 RepID=UPI00168112BC|nr:TfoX/Sxy family protein [Pseudoalteromonas sp. S16_S37]MBD1582458.1 TfoX/Sxy family protein [Pseudoalteromonas sp. S16_S37]